MGTLNHTPKVLQDPKKNSPSWNLILIPTITFVCLLHACDKVRAASNLAEDSGPRKGGGIVVNFTNPVQKLEVIFGQWIG